MISPPAISIAHGGFGMAGGRMPPRRKRPTSQLPEPDMRTNAKSPDARAAPPTGRVQLERAVAELGRRQYGVVTRSQLVRLGVSARVVDHAVATGRLQPIHRGVYGTGPALPPRAIEMAAVLACGDGAVLSHRSAAGLWEILPAPTPPDPIEVTVLRSPRRKPGIRVYRVLSLPPDEATHVEGIPVTSPARTLLDVAGVANLRDLERAVARAERSGLVTRRRIAALLERYPRRSGSVALRALIEGPASPALTRSEAEERFLEIVRRGQLRTPETNVVVEGFEVDFLWRSERFVVEVDGFAYHAAPSAFERDRRRDAVLGTHGYRVLRVTWSQLESEPEAVLVRVAQMLARAAAS